MSQARALSSDEVQHLRDELAAGRTPTVWFTASAVGVPEGRSGKVTALGEVEEGDFVQVRPASSRDELSFSAAEITLERPPRKRKDDAASGSSVKGTSSTASASHASSSARTTSGKAGAGDSAASQQKAPAEPTGRSAGSAGNSAAARSSKSAKSSKSAQSSGSAQSSKSAQSSGSARSSSSAQKPGSDQSTGSAQSTGSGQKSRQSGSSGVSKRKPRSISGATVTLSADDNGQWSVEVNTGRKRTLRPRTVSASAVAHAAKALHEDVAAAVEPLLESAREQQRARVEELQRELADAQRTLDELAE